MNGIDEICDSLEQGIMTEELPAFTEQITGIRKVAPATSELREAIEEFLK